MDKFKSKKIIGISIILFTIIMVSLLTYGKNKSNVFKDEYMKNIFIDEDNIEIEGSGESINLIEMESQKNNSTGVNNQDIYNDSDSAINTIVVEIKGEVRNPDVYVLNEGSIIKDLIEASGGLTNEADISNINRAKEVKNHDLIVIKNINDIDSDDICIESQETEEVDDGMININTADLGKLKQIPGIGDVKASAIITYREEKGGFKSIDELKNINGIGEKTFEKIKDSVKL